LSPPSLVLRYKDSVICGFLIFHIYFTWLTMFETKTPVKERAKIIKCYKQTQTVKQQDGKWNKNKTNKQRKQANIKTR